MPEMTQSQAATIGAAALKQAGYEINADLDANKFAVFLSAIGVLKPDATSAPFPPDLPVQRR